MGCPHRAAARCHRRKAGLADRADPRCHRPVVPGPASGSARLAAAACGALAARGTTWRRPAKRLERESREGGVVVRRVLARNVLPQTLTDPIETWQHARELPEEDSTSFSPTSRRPQWACDGGRSERRSCSCSTPRPRASSASCAVSWRPASGSSRPTCSRRPSAGSSARRWQPLSKFSSSATSAARCSSSTTSWTTAAASPRFRGSSTRTASPRGTGGRPPAPGSDWRSRDRSC